MSVQMVLLPVFVLVALTLVGFVWTGRRNGTAREDGGYLASQLDLLFYTLIALGLPLRKIDLVLVALSWVFVVVRVIGSGLVPVAGGSRFSLAGVLVLIAMWLYFALRMLLLI